MRGALTAVAALLLAIVFVAVFLTKDRNDANWEERAIASPGETASGASTPERGSTAAVPREAPPTQATRADRIVVRGRVVVSDPMRDGAESATESGSLYLVSESGGSEKSVACAVDAGAFEVEVPADAKVAIADVVLGRRRADSDVAERVPVTRDGAVTFRATWRPGTLLHVLGADTRDELKGVTIVRERGVQADLAEHPGIVAARDVVVENGDSPVFLPLVRLARMEDEGLSFFVRARSYAWRSLAVLDKSLERTVILDRSGDLVVTLENHEPDAGPEPPMLVLYRSSRRDESDERIVGSVEPERDVPSRFEGLLPGPYRVEVAIGWLEDDPIILGEADVVIEAGATTEATIRLADPPDMPQRVPLSGTLIVSPEWGAVEPSLTIESLDGHEVGANRVVTIEFEKLVPLSPGLFRFDSGAVAPGRHSAAILPWYSHAVFDIGREGRDDLQIAIPDPADVEIAFVDGESEERITPGYVYWACAWPDGVNRGGKGVAPDGEAGVFRFRAPSGPIDVSVSPDVYTDGERRIEAGPGRNAITLRLHRGCGVWLRFRVDGRPAPPGPLLGKARIRAVGHEGRLGESHSSANSGHIEMRVSTPGLYEVTLRETPGYRRPEPIRVEIPPGEFVERTIDLEPLR